MLITWAIKWYFRNKYIVNFWIMNTFYNWPLIGRKSKHKHDNTTNDGWTAGEVKLCEDYFFEYARMNNLNDNYYNLCSNYLGKSEEIGQKPIPFWVWSMLIIFVFAE